MDDVAKILAIGDVHLGTSCSGVPEIVSSLGVDPRELAPAAALKLSTDFAIEQEVEAVLLAGDVVESTNARFEAMPPLEECVRRLLNAGIEVFAVAGNHDFEALRRLADLVEGFTLLGADGKWEARVLRKNKIAVAEIIGWSFSERHVRQSPVAQLLAEPLEAPSTPIPRIGLLHGDLNASGGYYAPIRQVELDSTGHNAWLLGHIHKPSIEGLSTGVASRPSGYLGSLVGLDRSETGPHGPWLLRLWDGGGLHLEHIPLAPMRWEEVSISIEGVEHVEDAADRLLDALGSSVHRVGQEGPVPRALGLCARLTGTSPCHEDIRKRIAAGEWKDLGRVVEGTAVFFTKIIDSMTARVDLAEIAKGDDPAALMARRLIILGQDNDRSKDLLEQARAALSHIASDERWSPAKEQRNATNPLSDEALREVLYRSGMMVLNAMFSQNESGDPK